MSALAGTASSELHSPALQHRDSAQCSDLSGREDGYKWLQSAGKSSTEELLTLQVYIPCKALFMASFSFVPAQCSSVRPWSRWSLLRRLFSCQKSLVWAWAGSRLRCNGYRGSLKITPAAFPWSTLCFKDALVLLGWNRIMAWKRTFNSISSVQTLSQYHFLRGPQGWLYTLMSLRWPWRNWCPEKDKFLHEDNKITAVKHVTLLFGNSWCASLMV